MPDEARRHGHKPEPSQRRARSHARSHSAATRRVTSLRRSQRRLVGEDYPTAVTSEVPLAPQPTSVTGADDASPAHHTRSRLRASLLHPGRGQILAALEQTRSSLRSGADTQRVARAEAERHLTELSILAGTAPAEGRGIRMRIADPNAAVDAGVLLDAVEEMRDAGAEVIEVNNTIRVVASTWFGSDARGLVIDDKPVSRPITLEVIGDPHSLEEAAQFRGGIVSEITGPRIGGQVQLEQEDRLVIESLHEPRENQYARPAPPQSTPR